MISYEEKRAIVDAWRDALPPEPPADGILKADKPTGPTSFDIVAAVKRKYSTKVGHTGTLDPLASGLLILLLGPATKKAKEFEGLDKVYEVEAIFGEERDSYDAEGKIVGTSRSERIDRLTKERLASDLKQFIGKQEQRVPAFSAVKVDGKRLYDSAHKGQSMAIDQLPVKSIEIFSIDILNFTSGDSKTGTLPRFGLQVHCSKGTYIRSLVHDLGLALGGNAYVNQLRRLAVGKYSL